MSAPEWRDILQEPFVSLILGQRGSGKTALGHRLLEVFGDVDSRDAYILGFPEHLRDRLPDWIDVLPPTTGRADWPADSVVLVHEAHQLLHARRSMDSENVEIDELVTVSRHRNSDIIFETQQSQRLDRNSVTAVDAIILREPALLQADFERKQLRPIVKEAEETFEQYTETVEEDGYMYRETSEEVKRHAYIHSGRFIGEYPHEIGLAGYWTEDISRAYAEPRDISEGSEAGGLDEEYQVALDSVAAFEQENRPFDYSHKGLNHRGVPLERAWTQLQGLQSKGLLKITYESSNNPNEYRLTEEGWEQSTIDEPDSPELSEEAQES
jgi:hypothetical protein